MCFFEHLSPETDFLCGPTVEEEKHMKKRFIIALSFALIIVAGIIGYKVFNKRENISHRQMAIYIPN